MAGDEMTEADRRTSTPTSGDGHGSEAWAPAVVLRRGEVADIPALLAFWAVAGENASRPADDATMVENLLGRDPDCLLVAEQAGVIVGTVIAGWDGWRAHLYRLAVDPGCRGQGVGRRLVEAAEDRLRTLGAIRFDAMVLSENALGAHAWAAMGYRPQDDWTRWVRPA
ncbi:GNAT family N-acetyltransferase [Isoptericola sp. NPDC057191]|uniref:GNAT family N-acetyltransferase n=1 Tax=Isoptericola sp. NPDC057191 TaxID=3346041 RepID=UPI003634A184